MTIVREPGVDDRAERPYMGIRVQTPMKGMSTLVTRLSKELARWVKETGVDPAGPPFLRYHVIDMAGMMDIEYGYPVATVVAGDERVRPAALPAGRYASLVYTGSGISGNKALLDWARAQDIRWDRWRDPNGDAFRSRYETYLTDPRVEPRKTRWEIEVAIKLADAYNEAQNV